MNRCLSILCLCCVLFWNLTVQAAELPDKDGTVTIATQEWPFQPEPREVKVYIYYPGKSLQQVNKETGLILNLHNWGGTNTSGAGNPSVLTKELNVIAISVDYLQSGSWKDQSGAPYDFGYLQAIDALRALAFVFQGLQDKQIPFNDKRIYATGGSGGGNVTLMCNKFAPHTFTGVVDICGMPRLSDDIAYNLPGGSSLNARYSKDPHSPDYLTPGGQEIRYLGNPHHLKLMKARGHETKILIIHGSGDTTCPYADARDMYQNMKAAGLDVSAKFVTENDLDGKIFKSIGHSLGDRTQMIVQLGGEFIIPGRPQYRLRSSPTDIELKQDVVYPTSDGRYVISWQKGIPEVRFEAQ
ncbi:Prolyl oligopeptidase family protein [Gimesia chilikensis]|uniref:Prolyl oligopeptidase family protein n=1 Tax=Gimesia chilikensis TaxID=2605989 RepID=A0A517W940_9PLAN|nr:Prolyl oligopeptidase family protein [Gimesia chilikensis]